MAFRDVKRQMRRDLHTVMQVPALYILGADDPVDVNVRLHTRMAEQGASQQPAYGAERVEFVPKIRFDRSELVPTRGAIVSVETGEAYRVMMVEPPDDQFQFAMVAPLSASEAAGLPVPE